MIGKKILSTKPIVLAEVKELLKARSEEGELTYEQDATNDYAKKYAKLAKTKAAKLAESLKAIEGLSDELIVKIVDILPQNSEVLKLLIPKGTKLGDDAQNQIMDLVKKAQ